MFLKILFISDLCTRPGARTHNPEMESRLLYQISQPVLQETYEMLLSEIVRFIVISLKRTRHVYPSLIYIGRKLGEGNLRPPRDEE